MCDPRRSPPPAPLPRPPHPWGPPPPLAGGGARECWVGSGRADVSGPWMPRSGRRYNKRRRRVHGCAPSRPSSPWPFRPSPPRPLRPSPLRSLCWPSLHAPTDADPRVPEISERDINIRINGCELIHLEYGTYYNETSHFYICYVIRKCVWYTIMH